MMSISFVYIYHLYTLKPSDFFFLSPVSMQFYKYINPAQT